MKRPTFHVTAILVPNPDDVADLTAADIKVAVEARCAEVYVEANGASYEVRMMHLEALVEAITVDAEPDSFTVLLDRLTGLQTFHSDGDSEEDRTATAALAEAIDLLRTHALPEDHPLAVH